MIRTGTANNPKGWYWVRRADQSLGQKPVRMSVLVKKMHPDICDGRLKAS